MMEPRHRLEENSRRGGERGRTSVRQRGTFSELTWCLFLILSGVEIVVCNRPPRFVLDGNVGSEIVVRMREGEGGARGKRVLRLVFIIFTFNGNIVIIHNQTFIMYGTVTND